MPFTNFVQKTTSLAAMFSIIGMLFVLHPTAIFAQETYRWIQPGNGVFAILNNWSPFAVPGINDTALYDLDSEMTTFFLENQTVDVVQVEANADVTFKSSGFSGGNREFAVRFVTLTDSTSHLKIESGTSGQRMILNADTISTWGRISVQNGSAVSADNTAVGFSPFSGTVTVDGTTTTGIPSSWETNELVINRGNVVVSNGGTMIAPYINVFNGGIVVSNPDTTLISIDEIDFGTSGLSSFDIISGAAVHSHNINIAPSSNVLALFIIGGNGPDEVSTLTSTGNVVVGGRITHSGGDGNLDLNEYSFVEIAGNLKISEEGRVTLQNNSKLVVDTIENELGGAFEFFGGELQFEQFEGNLDNQGGALAPGGSDVASSLVLGNYSSSSGSTLRVNIGGTVPGTSHDFVNVSGQVLVDGMIDVAVDSGYSPEPADSFVIIAAGTLFGSFDNASNGQRVDTSDGSGSFVVNYGIGSSFDEDRVVLSDYQENQILGDVNADGDVNLLDVGPFVDILTNGDFVAAADINQDGVVNLLDVGPFVELLVG